MLVLIDERIAEVVDDLWIVDTHEHLMAEQERLKKKIDLFYLFPHYASSDLVSSGMPQHVLDSIRNTAIPLRDRWQMFEPFWRYVRTTAYGRTLIEAARRLFGIHDINDETYEELSEKIAQSNRPGWYNYVLKEEGRIEVSLECGSSTDVDKSFFAPVVNFEEFLIPRSKPDLELLAQKTDSTIHSLEDLERSFEWAFERALEGGMVAAKIGLAYSRPLRFEKVSRRMAEDLFSRIYRDLGHGLSWQEARPLQDYLVHRLVQMCIKRDLPIQIHTGIQEGNGNIISNSDPTLLTNLFLEYREAKFDIFHGAYPYCSQLAVLAKNFPCVYVDLCWLHVISPSVSKRMLHELIETVPSNKILAFGGDYVIVEGAYAHSRIARRVVAEVLSEKVSSGYVSREDALQLAGDLLRNNAWNLFGLEERWKRSTDNQP